MIVIGMIRTVTFSIVWIEGVATETGTAIGAEDVVTSVFTPSVINQTFIHICLKYKGFPSTLLCDFNFFTCFPQKQDVFRRDKTHLFTYAAYLYKTVYPGPAHSQSYSCIRMTQQCSDKFGHSSRY